MDVSHFDTSKATLLGDMFAYCSSLKKIDVSNWNVSKVKRFSFFNGMFYGCNSLTDIDVSRWNTANGTEFGTMFTYCTSLTELDISSFNTAKATDMSGMFDGSRNLKKLVIGEQFKNVPGKEAKLPVAMFEIAHDPDAPAPYARYAVVPSGKEDMVTVPGQSAVYVVGKTVTLDPNQGAGTPINEYFCYTLPARSLTAFADTGFVRDGFAFAGWNPASDGAGTGYADRQSLSFDSLPALVTAGMNEKITILEAPEKEGYDFQYWEGSVYYPGDIYPVTKDHTFTAIWAPKPTPTPTQPIAPQTGDETPLALYGAALCLSLMAVAALTAGRKREKAN